MNTNLVPDTIILRVSRANERERERLAGEERQKQEQLARKRETANIAWRDFAQVVFSSFPADLVPFIVISKDDVEDNSGPNSCEFVHIEIPSLAPIRARFDLARNEWSMKSFYIVPDIVQNADHVDGQISEVFYDWRNAYVHVIPDLDDALAAAQRVQKQFDEKLAELEAAQQGRIERHEAAEERRQREEQAEAQVERERETEATRQLREEQLLLDTLKDDPVAIALLKVFAAVQADREHWQELIEEVNESASWDAERHGEHLARIEALADANRRDAREAEDRANALESDLDDVKTKARKAGMKV